MHTAAKDNLKNDLNAVVLNKTPICMLQDYFLKEELHDIDIVCFKKDKRKIHKLLKHLGYKTFKLYSDSAFYHKLIGSMIIRIHLHYNNFFGFLGMNKIMQNKDSSKLNILTNAEYLPTLLYKIQVGRPSQKYMPEIEKIAAKCDFSELEQLLGFLFTKESSAKSVLLFKENKANDAVEALKLKTSFTAKRTAKRALSIFDKLSAGIKQLVIPSEYIAFIGTDGSGKTTTTTIVAETLRTHKFRVNIELGTRMEFKILPLNFLTSKMAKKKSGTGQSLHAIRYSSPFVKAAAPIVYYFEYLFRYMFSTFWKRRLNNFVLADRAYIDVIVSPNSNAKLAEFLYKILPKPSKVIFLYNDIQVLMMRRKEHPAEDLKRQLEEYKKHTNLYYASVKTESKTKSIEEILKLIFS